MFCQDLNVHDVSDLIHKIETLFADVKPGAPQAHVVLCTVHKAKGLEWQKVFILDFDKYMPSRFATSAWQRRQEKNLIYVAITRSMDTLVYITSDRWKEKV